MLAVQLQYQQNGAMAISITIRGVPEQTRDELAARAALSGRSLQEYLRLRLIDLAAGPDAESLISRIRQRKGAIGGSLTAEQIVAHRDADRA
jgi:antitoxin FitA